MKIKSSLVRAAHEEAKKNFQTFDDWKSKEPRKPTEKEASVPRLLESPGPLVWLIVIPVAIATGFVAYLSGTSIEEQILGGFFGLIAGALFGIIVITITIVTACEIAAKMAKKRNLANGWVSYSEWQNARP